MKKLSIFVLGLLFSSNLFANTLTLNETLTKFNSNISKIKYGAEFDIYYNNKINENSDFQLNLSTALYDRDNLSSLKKYETTGILKTKVKDNLKFYLGYKRTSIKEDDTVNKYSYIMGITYNREKCKANISYIYTPNIENNIGLNQANIVMTRKKGKFYFSNALTLQRFTKDELIFNKKDLVSDILKFGYHFNNKFSLELKGKLGQSIYKVDPYNSNLNILPFKEKYGAGVMGKFFIAKNVKFNLGLNIQKNDDGKDIFSSYDAVASLSFKF